MVTWHTYVEPNGLHNITGLLLEDDAVWSPQLQNQRPILVALPPEYASTNQHYPVIYMHDGQNLFDVATSYAGEWHVDETLQLLSQEGLPAIIVGIPNMGAQRIKEYSPFNDAHFGGGKGNLYLQYIMETLKPLIDHDFRTLPEREHTGLIGSSMGGLISLYGFFRYATTFGLTGVMSPSLWFAQGAITSYITKARFQPGRLYLDMGGREGPPSTLSRLAPGELSRSLLSARRLYQLLQKKGYRVGHDLLYVEAPEGVHNEAAWAQRLPDALRFLLRD
ncbi:MAG: alpha/beta hydrolase [Herpetosiphonaceae bacterium]|nr:alpha/beta hydrolase [Herpetosiphonaceae bacterium]